MYQYLNQIRFELENKTGVLTRIVFTTKPVPFEGFVSCVVVSSVFMADGVKPGQDGYYQNVPQPKGLVLAASTLFPIK